ncbi:hypothetical protein BpHYR1_005139 [Brachionus plicatilis]|uniref:Uncharacterized protein n=1 Tax=Brachionus plicatilis TaxID=10195 RepID=A0A3M7SNT0_BRAPC|nr:hypothetical protein BpHYR1_005139 [Brachionus plicatilis]
MNSLFQKLQLFSTQKTQKIKIDLLWRIKTSNKISSKAIISDLSLHFNFLSTKLGFLLMANFLPDKYVKLNYYLRNHLNKSIQEEKIVIAKEIENIDQFIDESII